MLGVSLGARLLRGVGGRRGQFGARGVSEGGSAMAAGESMAQRMVWVDLEVRVRPRGAGRRVQIREWDRGTHLSREAAGVRVSSATGEHGPWSRSRSSGWFWDCAGLRGFFPFVWRHPCLPSLPSLDLHPDVNLPNALVSLGSGWRVGVATATLAPSTLTSYP